MAAPFATGPIPRRQFTITRPTIGQHYDVASRDGQEHLFYIDVSCSFSRSQPDLTVHAGPNTAAPVVAVAHMPKLSGPFKIGVGDPVSHPNAVRWEDMMREGFAGTEHRWAVTLAPELNRVDRLVTHSSRRRCDGAEWLAAARRTRVVQSTIRPDFTPR